MIGNQAVANVTGRADLLTTLLLTLCSLCYSRAMFSISFTTRLIATVLSTVFLCLAILSKETALMWLPLLLLAELLRMRHVGSTKGFGWAMTRWISSGVCCILYLVWKAHLVQGSPLPRIHHLDNVLAKVLALILHFLLCSDADILSRCLGGPRPGSLR